MTTLPIIYSCDGCGACCWHVGHPMFSGAVSNWKPEQPWLKLPEPLRQEHLRYLQSLDGCDDGEPCSWLDLDSGSCKHYEHRPMVCREFDVGGEACRRFRVELGIDEDGD